MDLLHPSGWHTWCTRIYEANMWWVSVIVRQDINYPKLPPRNVNWMDEGRPFQSSDLITLWWFHAEIVWWLDDPILCLMAKVKSYYQIWIHGRRKDSFPKVASGQQEFSWSEWSGNSAFLSFESFGFLSIHISNHGNHYPDHYAFWFFFSNESRLKPPFHVFSVWTSFSCIIYFLGRTFCKGACCAAPKRSAKPTCSFLRSRSLGTGWCHWGHFKIIWDMLGACEIEIKQHSLERIPVQGDMCLKSMGRFLLLKILPFGPLQWGL